MSLSKMYKGDIGRKFILDADENITTATVVELRYIKPDGTTGTWSGSVENLKYAFYITQDANDLDQTGTWRVQLYVEIDGAKIHGDIEDFHVYKRLTDY